MQSSINVELLEYYGIKSMENIAANWNFATLPTERFFSSTFSKSN